MQPDLTNQKIVLTGITGGIARATAKRLLAMGAELIVTARNEDRLKSGLEGLDGKISGHAVDLADPDAIAGLFDKIGGFDHLVTPAASSTFSPIAELDVEGARTILETKQWAQMLFVHHAAKHIAKTGSITLFSGTVTQKPLPGSSMFAAVGGATEASARVWGMELAPIRVNTIVPGVIDTGIWEGLLGDDAARATMASFAETLPAGRVGTSDDIAKAVVFLIDNGFVDGISLVVDGGHRLI